MPNFDCVCISVRDTGTGMPPEVLARATEAFFTTKGPGKGTGLGLAMVQRMAQQHGGLLRIQTTPGVGTTMSVILPRAGVDNVALSPPTADTMHPSLHGNASLLVVDDDEQVRLVMAAFLREIGYSVVDAADAQAAEALATAATDLDLVVSGIGSSGLELAASLRKQRPGLPFIFLTAVQSALDVEDDPILPKPFAFSDLARAIASQLERLPPIAGNPGQSATA